MGALAGLVGIQPANELTAGTKVVASAGTAVALADSTSSKFVWIGAPHADGAGKNAASILIGDVDAQVMILTNDDYKGFVIAIDDPSKLFIDAKTSSDHVNYIIFN